MYISIFAYILCKITRYETYRQFETRYTRRLSYNERLCRLESDSYLLLIRLSEYAQLQSRYTRVTYTRCCRNETSIELRYWN